jgi:hypothetical protein
MSAPALLLSFQQAEQPESQFRPAAVWTKLAAKNKLTAVKSSFIVLQIFQFKIVARTIIDAAKTVLTLNWLSLFLNQ